MSSASTAPPELRTSRRPKLSDNDFRSLDRMFAIDSRALSVIRIVLAGFVLFQSLVLELLEPRNPASLAEALDQYGHVIVIPFAAMMLIGYKTRIAVALTWIAYSLPLRADLTADISVDMGFYILSIALFWCLFLPMGQHLSVDERRATNPPVRFLSVASGALLFQIFIIYFSAGLAKDIPEWLIDATAMETLMSLPHFTTDFGDVVREYPAVLAAMSRLTVLIEVIGALFVLVPGKRLEQRRMVLVPVFIAFHAGIALVMGLGIFPYLMMGIWLLFLPSPFWDKIFLKVRGSANGNPELSVDTSRLRNSLAAVAVMLSAVSLALVWIYYPTYEGAVEVFQDTVIFLLIYQQWLMFSAPSGLLVGT